MSDIGTGATAQQYSRCIKFRIYTNLKCGVLHSDLVNMWAMMSVSRVVRDTLMAAIKVYIKYELLEIAW